MPTDEYLIFLFFFFSSRRRHTRLQGDWSSDVCSSDLLSSNDTEAHLYHPALLCASLVTSPAICCSVLRSVSTTASALRYDGSRSFSSWRMRAAGSSPINRGRVPSGAARCAAVSGRARKYTTSARACTLSIAPGCAAQPPPGATTAA